MDGGILCYRCGLQSLTAGGTLSMVLVAGAMVQWFWWSAPETSFLRFLFIKLSCLVLVTYK